MKHLVIIGAGGMGRTLFGMAFESLGFNTEFDVRGFIDDDEHALDNFSNYAPIVGNISNYIPLADDVFVSSIGGNFRKACIESLLARGANFINLIHNTTRIRTNVQMGVGNVFCPYSVVGADVVMGSFNLLQNFTVIGHDVHMGDYNRIDTHVTCVGGVRIGNMVDVYTSAVLNHGVVVEDNAHVGALSFVIRRVKSGTTVYGNPARRL